MSKFLKAAVKFAETNGYSAQILTFRRCTTRANTNSPEINVPGLSKKVVDLPDEKVGFPKAAKEAMYKNPEYFCYNKISYFEAEVEMLKYRLPQPSNKAKK